MDVNDALISLRQFGNEAWFYGSWCASIKMDTTVTGGEFEISSGFRRDTSGRDAKLIDQVNGAMEEMTRALLLILLLPADTAVVNIPTPEQAQCRVQLVMRLAMTEMDSAASVRADNQP